MASYVDIGLLESLGLIGLPDHVALGGIGVEADPSFELVIGRHFSVCCGVDWRSGAKIYNSNAGLKTQWQRVDA